MRIAPLFTHVDTFFYLDSGLAPTCIGKPHTHSGEHAFLYWIVAYGGARCLAD